MVVFVTPSLNARLIIYKRFENVNNFFKKISKKYFVYYFVEKNGVCDTLANVVFKPNFPYKMDCWIDIIIWIIRLE